MRLTSVPHASLIEALSQTDPNPALGIQSVDVGHDALPPPPARRPGLTVLDVTKWFGETSGGVRTYLQHKSRYVSERPDLRHVLVIPSRRDLVSDQGNVRWYRLRGPRVPTQPQYRFLLAPRSLRRIILHEKPDVIEVGSPVFVPWVVASASRGTHIPLVSFYHTNLVAASHRTGGGSKTLHTWLRMYARLLDRLFTSTLVASDCAAADLASAGVTRISRVPLGVDVNTFTPLRRERADQTRSAYGLPTDRPLVLYLGRLAAEKCLEVAIDGWRRFDPERKAALAIAGDGPLGPALRERAGDAAIHFLPFQTSRESVADLLAAADIYLSPSPVETFGLAALEALSCGTPLVASDKGGVAEHVRRSNAGVLFRAGDPESVADAVRRCLDARPAELGRLGREFVLREHDWDTVFDRIFDVYRAAARQ
jgi:alpha-1,6-mannosyltransferase